MKTAVQKKTLKKDLEFQPYQITLVFKNYG